DALKLVWDRAGHLVEHVRLEGLLVQEQLDNRLEAVVGFTASGNGDATVLMGSGGVLVELLEDTAVGIAPLSKENATELLRRTKLAKRMDGFRGLLPTTSLEALASLASRVSTMAHDFSGLLEEV